MVANSSDLDIRNYKKSNDGGDSSDDDAENSTNYRDNAEGELDPSILENLLLDDSNYELTTHHVGYDGSLAQPINMKQEARKSVRVAKEKAYLSGRIWCAALLEMSLSSTLECKVILMTLLPILWLICSLEVSISGAVSTMKSNLTPRISTIRSEERS